MSGRFDLGWLGDGAGDGALVEIGAPAFALADPLALCGDGLFETMRVVPAPVAARVPLLARHLRRLRASAAAFGLAVPPDGRLAAAIAALLAASRVGDAVLRLTIGRGVGGGARTALGLRPFRVVACPLRLVVVAARRHPDDPSARHKTTSRAFWRLAQLEAEAAGADEAVVLDDAGAAAETTNGNLFGLVDGRLVTPPLPGPLLPGVARGVLIEALATDGGMPVVERPVSSGDLAAATALWTSNAVHGARPAVMLDSGRAAAAAGVGADAHERRLREAFRAALTG